MKQLRNSKGFTLIELLLVVVIIGLMLAVIVPRAMRANVDAKYGNVRQIGSELASWAVEWAESEVQSQDAYTDANASPAIVGSTATTADYLAYLCGDVAAAAAGNTAWVADDTAANTSWVNNAVDITGRIVDTVSPLPPSIAAKNFVPIDKIPRNPFNQLSVFATENYPATGGLPVPGALAMGYIGETGNANFNYYALLFQGTDAQTYDLTAATKGTRAFHGNMNHDDLEGLRNGIFVARYADAN
ncbi:type II secretion system protein [Desulfobacula phenolica]|uniref:Prepilin-type N-terminal cleavage/methylation domain-containing protein n=1 Tax=Desulfobacula phenolica TaxID=90732 RepID=A0A1H2J077_9BACT|nr:prepilin-type N-terminal cleavage/methylation domain-containing protein [Desulfobacula phenolica]SDU49803.1 prepilin-type N-terminal cleavage/methylation domain-containing protein [Desulfobacula phenolica]